MCNTLHLSPIPQVPKMSSFFDLYFSKKDCLHVKCLPRHFFSFLAQDPKKKCKSGPRARRTPRSSRKRYPDPRAGLPGLWRGLRPVGSVRIVDEARTNVLHGWSPRTSIRSLLNRAAGESTAEAAAGVVTGCGTRRMETAALDATDHVRALAPILRKYLGVATTGQSIPRAGD